jgi:hypothetical protein
MAKAFLQPGEKRTVRLSLTCDALSILDSVLAPRLEPGAIEIFVGPCARADTLQKVTIDLVA